MSLCLDMGSGLIMLIGYDSAFIGGTLALHSFKRDFGLLDKDKTVTAALSAHIVSTCECFRTPFRPSLSY